MSCAVPLAVQVLWLLLVVSVVTFLHVHLYVPDLHVPSLYVDEQQQHHVRSLRDGASEGSLSRIEDPVQPIPLEYRRPHFNSCDISAESTARLAELSGRVAYAHTIWHSRASVGGIARWVHCTKYNHTKPFREGWQDDIRHGDVIHLCSGVMEEFFSTIFPLMPVGVVLIYHGPDYTLPGRSTLSASRLRNVLADPRIIAWYAQNLIGKFRTEKLRPIPIGLSLHSAFCQHQATAAFYNAHGLWRYEQPWEAVSKLKRAEPKYTLLVEFTTSRKRPARSKLRRRLCNSNVDENPLAGHVFCLDQSRRNLLELNELRSRFKFILSPPGFGMDCYRTYEALLMGTYPIITASKLDPSMWDGLPVLVLSSMEEVFNLTLLVETYNQFSRTTYWPGFERLYAEHWADEMEELARDALHESDLSLQ